MTAIYELRINGYQNIRLLDALRLLDEVKPITDPNDSRYGLYYMLMTMEPDTLNDLVEENTYAPDAAAPVDDTPMDPNEEGIEVLVFDEHGLRTYGKQSPEDLHNMLANFLGD